MTLKLFVGLSAAVAMSNLVHLPVNAADIQRVKCDIALIGRIEPGDEVEFRQRMTEVLKSDCASPQVHLYSQGGDLLTALDIAEQVNSLQIRVNSPRLPGKGDGPRSAPRRCDLLPGSKERLDRAADLDHAHAQAVLKALQIGKKIPPALRDHGDFDPEAGIGDPRCACASVCFFIWAAGSERWGDVIQIHRPYFNPQEYAKLDAGSARAAYQRVVEKSRKFLSQVGIHNSIIERMFSVDSQNASYLTIEELASLKMVPYWSEMKIAKCGPEPRLEDQPNTDNYPAGAPVPDRPYAALSSQQLNWFLKRAKREVCWRDAQAQARRPLVEQYIAAGTR